MKNVHLHRKAKNIRRTTIRTNYCYNSWASSIPSSGGWGFSGYGTRGPFWTRFWVAINDQPANCWN